MRIVRGMVVLGLGWTAALAEETTPPATDAPTATPAALSSRQVQDALLVVMAREGSGSGFVGNVGGTRLLVTNAHVIAGATQLQFQLLSGAPVPPGAGRLAIGHDVAAFAAPDTLLALEVSPDVGKEVAIGDEVVVYGNSQGASVVTELKGKVVGL